MRAALVAVMSAKRLRVMPRLWAGQRRTSRPRRVGVFVEWARDGLPRHPEFVDIRDDKSPRDVRREDG
jgi:hypothetical protein